MIRCHLGADVTVARGQVRWCGVVTDRTVAGDAASKEKTTADLDRAATARASWRRSVGPAQRSQDGQGGQHRGRSTGTLCRWSGYLLSALFALSGLGEDQVDVKPEVMEAPLELPSLGASLVEERR